MKNQTAKLTLADGTELYVLVTDARDAAHTVSLMGSGRRSHVIFTYGTAEDAAHACNCNGFPIHDSYCATWSR